MYKKGISPIIATLLLLIVGVTVVIGFQDWSVSYISNLFVDVEEEKNNNNVNFEIEDIIGENLYLFSQDNINIKSVKIDSINCENLNGTYSGNIKLNVSSCLDSITTSKPEVVITSQSRVSSKVIILRENN